MSERDEVGGQRLEEELGGLARKRAQEVEVWWDAAERRDASALPDGSPSIEALRPIDDLERARMQKDLFPGRAPNRRVWIASAVAIAAGVAGLMFYTPAEKLPAYTMSVQGGDRVFRSKEEPVAELPRYQSGSRMEIVLQPELAIEAAPEISAEVIGQKTVAWPTAIERGRGGTFRLVAEIGTELPLDRGIWQLSIVLGRRDKGQHFEYRFEVGDGS